MTTDLDKDLLDFRLWRAVIQEFRANPPSNGVPVRIRRIEIKTQDFRYLLNNDIGINRLHDTKTGKDIDL